MTCSPILQICRPAARRGGAARPCYYTMLHMPAVKRHYRPNRCSAREIVIQLPVQSPQTGGCRHGTHTAGTGGPLRRPARARAGAGARLHGAHRARLCQRPARARCWASCRSGFPWPCAAYPEKRQIRHRAQYQRAQGRARGGAHRRHRRQCGKAHGGARGCDAGAHRPVHGAHASGRRSAPFRCWRARRSCTSPWRHSPGTTGRLWRSCTRIRTSSASSATARVLLPMPVRGTQRCGQPRLCRGHDA